MGILKVPKATTAQRVAITLAEAEVVYDTDLKKLCTGDGVTAGGNLDSLSLGETSTTAYRGDRGKIAYDNRIVSLTTTGSSGSASLVSNVLNIPTYTLSGLGGVPYSGASSDLDLGSNNLNAQAVHIKGTGGAGHLGLRTQSSDASASANEIALFADSSGNLKYKYDGTYYVTLLTSGNTANRTYTFQNASGTLAFTSDLLSYTPTTRSISTTAPLSGGGDLSSNRTLSITQATTSTDGYLSSTDWNTFNGKQNALSGTGFVKISGTTISYDNSTYLTGNQSITLSGEVTGSGSTSITVTLSNSAVIGKVLTGYISGAGTITSTDTILQAIQKLNGNIGALVTGVSSVNSQTGTVTLTTSNISEGSNLYYTNARTIASTLTGYTSGAGVVSSTDTILQAIQKLNGNIGTKQDTLVSGTNIKTFAGNSILGSGAITIPCEIQLACSDESTSLTAGTNKVVFRMPYAMTVTEVRASLTTAQTSGSIFTIDINENGTSIISTKLTIDNTEKTSVTALTPAVISDSSLADDSEITIDIDQIGDGTAKGLKVTIKGTRTA